MKWLKLGLVNTYVCETVLIKHNMLPTDLFSTHIHSKHYQRERKSIKNTIEIV